MTQKQTDSKDRAGIRMSAPLLAGIIAGVAAVAVAATLALQPKQTTVTPEPAAQQQTIKETELVTIPDVCGLERQNAEKALANARLDMGEKTEDYSDSVPAGCVISQDPVAGTLANLDSKVSLVISRGRKAPEQTTMPNLVGKTREQAEKALADAKLVAVQGPAVVTDKVDPGLVCDQSIAAGTKLSQDTHVSYSTAIAPDTSVQVPNLAGEPVDDARKQLQDAGLASDTSLTYHDTVAKDHVVTQSIDAGTKVAKGTVVTITVSLGAKPEPSKPEPVTVTVPNIMTYDLDDALTALWNAGLAERWSGEENGTVVSQDPEAGTEVEEGTVVTFQLEHISSKVTVPDVRGMSAEDADYQLRLVGLSLDYDEDQGDMVLDGTDPVAGALLDEGSQVRPVFADPQPGPATEPEDDPNVETDDPDQAAPDDGDADPADADADADSADAAPDVASEPLADAAPADADTASDQDGDPMFTQVLGDAGVDYKVVKILKTQAADDGTNYTLLCRDSTGDYHVTIHVPGTSGAKASLVKVTPVED